jgi:hypothetical protein
VDRWDHGAAAGQVLDDEGFPQSFGVVAATGGHHDHDRSFIH